LGVSVTGMYLPDSESATGKNAWSVCVARIGQKPGNDVETYVKNNRRRRRFQAASMSFSRRMSLQCGMGVVFGTCSKPLDDVRVSCYLRTKEAQKQVEPGSTCEFWALIRG
jgi:hypothetical protein